MKLFITGTGTEVGKTWLACQLLPLLRQRGITPHAYKPVESFDPNDCGPRDSTLLANAALLPAEVVCPRQIPLPMAPPRAAQLLGMDPFTIADLEMTAAPATDWIVTEGAGGVASPIASNGDNRDYIDAFGADHILVVAHAGLGAVNACTLVHSYLGQRTHSFFLNWYDEANPVHSDNQQLITRLAPTATTPDQVLKLLIP